MHPVALTCSAALGLLLFTLGFAVSGLRFRAAQLSGTPPDATSLLHKVIRAHANTAEYAPFLAVLFLYLGSRGPGLLVLSLIVAATVSRFALVAGLVAGASLDKPNPLRFTGALGTYFAGAGLCIALVAGW